MNLNRRSVRGALLVALIAGALAALGAAPALAGTWMQAACVNPDGSAAPSDGWTSFAAGSVSPGSNNDINCAPGNPMVAMLSTQTGVPTGTSETVEYQPPIGSSLIGGSVEATLYADGYGQGASGDSILYEPAFQYDGSNVFYQCAHTFNNCPQGADSSGVVQLPANRGGNFYASAACGGQAGASCNTGGSHGAWSMVQVGWAHFLLSNSSAPQGSGFSGSALQPGVRGTGHLVFTASDPNGPGVYAVTVLLDGHTVSSDTPNTNGGKCVPAGTDSASGALVFDWQQPCPATEVVDAPVPTAGASDGQHELSVIVTDAAHNTSTVLDQTITTSNPVRTPKPHGAKAIAARFVISWRWTGAHTVLRSIRTERLPRRGTLSVRCSGRGCPRIRRRSARTADARAVLRGLTGRRFRAGDRLLITVSAPGRRRERIQLTIRDGKLPAARLLAG